MLGVLQSCRRRCPRPAHTQCFRNVAALLRAFLASCGPSFKMQFFAMASSTPIVIDSGSGMIKAGRCGQELPEVVFSSCVGRPKHHRVMASALEAETLMGSDVQKHRGVCSLKYPCQRGVIQDWDDMQRVWGQVFRDLRVQPEEHAILLTESPLVSSAQVIALRAYMCHAALARCSCDFQRKKTAEIMFETFRVPALCFSMQAVLSL